MSVPNSDKGYGRISERTGKRRKAAGIGGDNYHEGPKFRLIRCTVILDKKSGKNAS